MNTTLSNGVVQRKERSIKGGTLSCLSFKGTSSRGLNKERVMGAVKRATILGEIQNAPQDLTLFGKGLLKFGRKESENGAKGQERGQAKGKAKESPPKETWESVVLPRIARRKLLAQTGQGVMAERGTRCPKDTQ